MSYPKDFVEAVKAAYPDKVALHEHLDRNAFAVGGHLDPSGRENMSPEKVVTMIDQGKITELRAEALEKVTQRRLYDWWSEIQESHRD